MLNARALVEVRGGWGGGLGSEAWLHGIHWRRCSGRPATSLATTYGSIAGRFFCALPSHRNLATATRWDYRTSSMQRRSSVDSRAGCVLSAARSRYNKRFSTYARPLLNGTRVVCTCTVRSIPQPDARLDCVECKNMDQLSQVQGKGHVCWCRLIRRSRPSGSWQHHFTNV